MRKNKLILVIAFIFIFSSSVCALYIISNKDSILYEEKDVKRKDNLFAVMVETEAKSGVYNESTSNEWLTDGYVFNSELSGCENGGTLYWDDNSKQVIMEGNLQDKCYVYFKVYVEPEVTLSQYVISQYTGTQGDNGLYYHDSSLENGAGDNSYRYAGANPSNYVCFGSEATTCPVDNLYRIIGIFDDRIKLVKADYVTSDLLGIDGDYKSSGSSDATLYKGNISESDIALFYWNYKANNSSSNIWSTSLLNKINLNTNYLNNIGSKWADMIDVTTWIVGGISFTDSLFGSKITYQNEIVNPASSTTYEAKVGLMYGSDYGLASSLLNSEIQSENWINLYLSEWLITPVSGSSGISFMIDSVGKIESKDSSFEYAVRPAFYLLSSIKYLSGSGSQTDPIRISL